MTRWMRVSLRCVAGFTIAVLVTLLVQGEISNVIADPLQVPSTAPADSSSLQTPAVPLANVTDEQVGSAITRGVDFLLSNFDQSQLKPLDGEETALDHAGINALCVDALLEAERATRDPRLKPGDPFMKAVLDHLKHERFTPNGDDPSPIVFARSMRASALAVNNRPQDHQVLEEDVLWLLRAHRDGAYTMDDRFGTEIAVAPADSPGPQTNVPTIGLTTGISTGGTSIGMPTTASSAGPMTVRRPLFWRPPAHIPIYKPIPIGRPLIPRFRIIHPPYVGVHTAPVRGVFLNPPRTGSNLPPPPPRMTSPGRPLPTSQPARTGADPTAIIPPREPQPLPYPWDAADSMFGLLGVRAGAESGIDIPPRYWLMVQNHWLGEENEDGTWAFSDQQQVPDIGSTFAGDFSLLITHAWLGTSQNPHAIGFEPYHPGLKQALKWLESGDNSVTVKDEFTDFASYNLFLLARLGEASGYKFFGTHDWYRELAARIIPTQWQNGAFGRAPYGYDAVIQTAYTLIFLSSGRHPIFMEKLKFDDHWANRPRDVANVTRFASRELERSLNWEVVPVDRDWTDWLDSPVLFIASHQTPMIHATDYQKLHHFAQIGGILFTHADAGSAEFNNFIETQLVPAVFPDCKMEDIPADDPLFSAHYQIQPPLPKLRGVRVHGRWVLVHSPADLAANWQNRREKEMRSEFELAVNLFVYANGRSEPRNRLVPSAYTLRAAQRGGS